MKVEANLYANIRLVNSHFLKKAQKTRTRDFERNNSIPFKSRIKIPLPASLACLLPVLFLSLEYRRSLVYANISITGE